jgi:hypothetical protein
MILVGKPFIRNKTRDQWLKRHEQDMNKKYEFDTNQIYEPVLSEIDGKETKSYTGAELLKIKDEYAGTERYIIELSMDMFKRNMNERAFNIKHWKFIDILTADEENLYWDKSSEERLAKSERKSFYVVRSNENQSSRISISDLENGIWYDNKWSTIDFYLMDDVEPYFDNSKGHGRKNPCRIFSKTR